MRVGQCFVCHGYAEPPLTYAEDVDGRPTGLAVCLTCLDGVPDEVVYGDPSADDPEAPGAPGG